MQSGGEVSVLLLATWPAMGERENEWDLKKGLGESEWDYVENWNYWKIGKGFG